MKEVENYEVEHEDGHWKVKTVGDEKRAFAILIWEDNAEISSKTGRTT